MADMSCQQQACAVDLCQDGDGDGRGIDCAQGTDECEGDGANWTVTGCAACHDADGDGTRGNGCDAPEDPCDGDAFNWTAAGCADCRDADGDGWRGSDCDVPEDCDDLAPGVSGPCQADGCPQGWIHIPAGPFQRGCNEGELDGTCEPDERPRHVATLSSYCMQPTELSVHAFRACRDAGVCTGGLVRTTGDNEICNYSDTEAGREFHPLNCVTWEAARQYCLEWMGGELPTEAQWEKAARGADPDTRKFPWGNGPEPSCDRCNYAYCHSSLAPVTWPVGFLANGAGDSPYGLKDMAGNLWEMTLDTYVEAAYAACAGGCADPVQLGGGVYKVIRGGGFHHPIPAYHRVTERSNEDPSATSLNLGFRCSRHPW